MIRMILISMLLLPGLAEASWSAYVVGPGTKYRPTDSPPSTTTLSLKVARGQWAAFQVALIASGEDVAGANVAVTTPAKSGDTFAAPIIYKEEIYNVLVKSRDDGMIGEWPDALVPKVDAYYDEERNAFPFAVGRVGPVHSVFDISVASAQPVTRVNGATTKPTIAGAYSGESALNYHIKIDGAGAKGEATFKWSDDGGSTWDATEITTGDAIELNSGLTITFAVQNYTLNDEWEFFANTSRTQMVWVDSYVPITAPTGTYSSTITVSATAKDNIVLTVNFAVYNVTIPKTSTISTRYNASRDQIAEGHWQSFQCFTATCENLYKRYIEAGLRHRISLQNLTVKPTWSDPDVGNWSNYVAWIGPYMNGTWDTGTGDAQLTVQALPNISGHKYHPILYVSVVNESDLTSDEQAYLAALDDLIDAEGWMSKYHIYLTEEPGGTGFPTAAQTEAVTNATSTIHGINAGYRLMNIKRYVADWDDGIFEIWSPNINHCGDYPRSDYNTEVTTYGAEIWINRTCMSHGCYTTGNSDYNKWPEDMIDIALPNLRAAFWLYYDWGAHGDLYYQISNGYRFYLSSYSSPSPYDPWDSVFDFGGNADGTFFFPGRPDKIGGSTDIPVETIRLKALRMGLEDWEIFKLVSAAGYSSEVTTAIQGVTAISTNKYFYTTPVDYDDMASDMESARDTILGYMGLGQANMNLGAGGTMTFGAGGMINFQ